MSPEDDPKSAERRAGVRRRTLRHRLTILQIRAHHRFPRIIPDPSMRGVHQYRKERDPSENLEWSIPDSQHVSLSTFWLVELYPPSRSIDLMRDLRQAGWRSDFGQSNLLEW